MLFIFLFLSIANMYAAEKDSLLALISDNTHHELSAEFAFDTNHPFGSLIDFIKSNNQQKKEEKKNFPILFYSLNNLPQKPFNNDGILFIPLKSFNGSTNIVIIDFLNIARDFTTALGKFIEAKRTLNDDDSLTLSIKIYATARDLTRAYTNLLDSLEKHPNIAITEKAVECALPWNTYLRTDSFKPESLEMSIRITGPETSLSQLKYGWFVPYNYVIASTRRFSNDTLEQYQERTNNALEEVKKTIKTLEELNEKVNQPSIFNRIYGKKYLILCVISCCIVGLLFYFNRLK